MRVKKSMMSSGVPMARRAQGATAMPSTVRKTLLAMERAMAVWTVLLTSWGCWAP